MSMASLMEKKREADMENAQGEAMLDFKNRLFAHESELKDKQFAQKKMIEDYLLFNAAPTTTDVAGKPAVVTPSKNGPQVKFAPTGAGSRGAGQPDDMYVSGADAARYGVSAKTTYGQLRQMNAIPMSDKTAQDLAAGPGRRGMPLRREIALLTKALLLALCGCSKLRLSRPHLKGNFRLAFRTLPRRRGSWDTQAFSLSPTLR
jgi:hypothetical protein